MTSQVELHLFHMTNNVYLGTCQVPVHNNSVFQDSVLIANSNYSQDDDSVTTGLTQLWEI